SGIDADLDLVVPHIADLQRIVVHCRLAGLVLFLVLLGVVLLVLLGVVLLVFLGILGRSERCRQQECDAEKGQEPQMPFHVPGPFWCSGFLGYPVAYLSTSFFLRSNFSSLSMIEM